MGTRKYTIGYDAGPSAYLRGRAWPGVQGPYRCMVRLLQMQEAVQPTAHTLQVQEAVQPMARILLMQEAVQPKARILQGGGWTPRGRWPPHVKTGRLVFIRLGTPVAVT